MNFFSFWWQPFLCTRGITARLPMERLQRWTKASSSCWKPSNATWQGMSFFGDLPNGLFYIDFPAEKPSQQTIVKSRESALFCVIFWLHWSEQYWFLFCFVFLTSRWRFMMRTEIAPGEPRSDSKPSLAREHASCCILRQAYSPQDNPKLTQISLKRWMVTCDHQPDEVILCSRQSASVSFLAPFPTILKLI